MKVLLSCRHYPVAAGRYVYWALRRMGHEVVTVGPAEGAFLPWANGTNLEPYEWKPDIPLSPAPFGSQVFAPLSDALNRLATPPDLIIQMDAHFVMGGKAPCPNVLWMIDNHLTPYGEYEQFDRIFIAHSWGYGKDESHAEWLPCAHDPQHHFVIDENAPRPFDVAVVGVMYPQRQQMIEALRAAGLKVFAAQGAIYEQYNRIYNAAKVALVVSSKRDVAMRVFENMAQGCLVVADEAADMERCGFRYGEDYVSYANVSECVSGIKAALANDRARNEIIRNARAAVAPHSWENRVKHILEAVKFYALRA